MAKIVITIEDKPDGGVKVTADPTFETIGMIDLSNAGSTAAHSFAIEVANVFIKKSKANRERKLKNSGIIT